MQTVMFRRLLLDTHESMHEKLVYLASCPGVRYLVPIVNKNAPAELWAWPKIVTVGYNCDVGKLEDIPHSLHRFQMPLYATQVRTRYGDMINLEQEFIRYEREKNERTRG
jgi:hypothetical protein